MDEMGWDGLRWGGMAINYKYAHITEKPEKRTN